MDTHMLLRTARLLAYGASLLAAASSGCNHETMESPPTGPSSMTAAAPLIDQTTILGKGGTSEATQVNLVSDITGIPAKRTDVNLLNAWGIAISPTGILWIAANHSSLSVVYDKNGNSLRSPVSIPTVGNAAGGAPTGALFNPTNHFPVPGNGMAAKFIFAGEDGIISAWNSGSSAVVAADRSGAEAVYKGIAMARVHRHARLYATNFKGGTVEEFDENFKFISDARFKDPGIPADFAPFNIRNIDGNLFVTFAKHKGPDNEDDQSGPGFGYVDVFSPEGWLIKRFASQGTLNSPWGLAEVEEGHGSHRERILVGNFGDGKISIFDTKGNFRGLVMDGHKNPIVIEGLWAITFLDDHEGRAPNKRKLYFTAGPNEESDGVFGFLNLEK